MDRTASLSPQNLKQPGLLIEEVFKRTRAAVLQATDGVQVPWENSSLVSSVVLVPGAETSRRRWSPRAISSLATPPIPSASDPASSTRISIPQTAIPACQQAISEHPEQPRYKSLAARALEKAGRYDEAIALNQEAMQSGYLGAYHNLGNHYKKGAGVTQDLKKALELFEYAGERGEPEDQYNVGVLYIDGKGGIPADYVRAEEWLTKATEQNWAAAYDKLGILTLQGLGQPKNEAKANEYFRQGAALGDASAMVNLANSYRQGRGLAEGPRDGAGLLPSRCQSRPRLGLRKPRQHLPEGPGHQGRSGRSTVLVQARCPLGPGICDRQSRRAQQTARRRGEGTGRGEAARLGYEAIRLRGSSCRPNRGTEAAPLPSRRRPTLRRRPGRAAGGSAIGLRRGASPGWPAIGSLRRGVDVECRLGGDDRRRGRASRARSLGH